jgi:hypothetical protein
MLRLSRQACRFVQHAGMLKVPPGVFPNRNQNWQHTGIISGIFRRNFRYAMRKKRFQGDDLNVSSYNGQPLNGSHSSTNGLAEKTTPLERISRCSQGGACKSLSPKKFVFILLTDHSCHVVKSRTSFGCILRRKSAGIRRTGA